jgi:hypothetical protein
MAVEYTTTKRVFKSLNMLVYGASGVGKTKLAKTCESPIIIASENKFYSLKDFDIPVTLVSDGDEFKEEVEKIVNGHKRYDKHKTVVVDSMSDILQKHVEYLKKNPIDGNPNKKAAYGALIDYSIPIIEMLCDCDKHFVALAKQKKVFEEESGMFHYEPLLPGQALGPITPYLFDFVFALRRIENEEGKVKRYLQTDECDLWAGKGDNGKLKQLEKANIKHIISKTIGSPKKKKKGVVSNGKTEQKTQ